jgi:hypothetical protein
MISLASFILSTTLNSLLVLPHVDIEDKEEIFSTETSSSIALLESLSTLARDLLLSLQQFL